MTTDSRSQPDNNIQSESKIQTETKVLIQVRPKLVNKAIGLIIAVIAVAALWGVNPASPIFLISAAIFIMLLMGLNRPVWAVGAIIVQQLTATGYMISTPFGLSISLRLVVLILVGLVLWRSFRKERLEIGPQAKITIGPAILLILLSLISNFINSGWSTTFKDFRELVTGLMILSFIPLALRNKGDLMVLCSVTLVGITASSLVGVMQHFGILGMQSATLFPGLASSFGGEFRVPGMTETQLELSYVLSCSVLVLVGVAFLKGLHPSIQKVLPAGLLVMTGALYFTYTRSALIAVGLGLVSLFLFMRTRIRGEAILIMMLIISGILVISPLGGQYIAGRPVSQQEDSTVSRQILWQAGLSIALDHPIIGIGSDKFMEVSKQYQSSVDPLLIAYEKREYWGYTTLGNVPPHNDFLNMWVSYGTFALLVFITLFVIFLRNLLGAFQISRDGFLKGLAVGLAAALVAYGVNAFYHNVVAAISLFWIMGGFSLAISKLVIKKELC